MMKMRLVSFGEIDIDGQRYTHDVVVAKGQVRKRKKKLSKAYRSRFHTVRPRKESVQANGECS